MTEGLPDWVAELRPHQIQAVTEILEAFKGGAKVVLLDAPTGSGKTLIGELVRREIGGDALYTCSTKSLQDQVLRDFDYARVLKGRANYPTKDYPHLFDLDWVKRVTCEDCTWDGEVCRYCPTIHLPQESGKNKAIRDCPYIYAKAAAVESPFAVLNSAYMLNEINGPRTSFANRELGIIDEADTLESALMGWAELRITKKRQAQLKIDKPKIATHTAKSAVGRWRLWIWQTLQKVETHVNSMPSKPQDKYEVREKNYWTRLKFSLIRMRGTLVDGDNKPLWVYDPGRTDDIVFKPVKVDHIAEQAVWRHAERWLLMSASIISADELAESLGIHDWALVTVPSTFPKENRPVHVVPVADMTAKNKEAAYPAMADAVKRVLDVHPNERVLIHTVSYDLAKYLLLNLPRLGRPVFSYAMSDERDQALQRYIVQPNSVLIAPSMDRGIDLPGDLCRVQVVCKVPYPYLGDKQVNARLYSRGGAIWYAVQTIRTLVQMTGRGVRSATDQATTYILDQQFLKVYSKNRRLFPDWWLEALNFSNTKLRKQLAA